MTAAVEEKKPFLPWRNGKRSKSESGASTASASRRAESTVGESPVVDLLPPQVRADRRSRTIVRVVVYLVVILIGVVIAAVALVSLVALAAQANLEREEARTAALLDEQIAYAEGSSTAQQITELSEARAYGASTEVDWKKFLDPLRDSLPEGASIASAVASTPAPWETPLIPADSLRSARVGTITFTLVTVTQADATGWARALVTVPGYADSSTDSVTFDTEKNAFVTEITLNVGEDARANRFAQTEEE